jgi:hypothetical protein
MGSPRNRGLYFRDEWGWFGTLNAVEYSTDLTEVLAVINAIPVTDDAIEEESTDPVLFDEIQEYYPMLPHADMALVRRLEQLCRKYPTEAKIRNHLAAAYQYMGKESKATQTSRAIFRDFPDYLFARVNEVAFLLGKDQPDEALKLLGPRLSLTDLYPETELFHLSELRSFYHSVAMYHFYQDRDELADGVARHLLERHPDPHPPLESLRKGIELKRMQGDLRRMDEEQARMIRVREGKKEENFSKELPKLNHRELEILYRRDYDLGKEKVEELLALPRVSLVADLEVILRDCFARTAYFQKLARRSGNEHKLFGVIHALFLLGELEARESLAVVLETLEAHGEALEFWLGDGMDEDLWQPLYQLVGDDLERVTAWFLSPGRSHQARNLMSGAVVQGVFHQPERAGAIFEWLGGMLKALLEVSEEDNVYDTRVAQELVAWMLDFCLKEHHELVLEFYGRPDYQQSFLGKLEEIEEDLLADPPEIKRDLLGIVKCYRRFTEPQKQNGGFDRETMAARLKQLAPDSQILKELSETSSTQSESAGRNDPCPCGSGKKYKKCCL